MRFDMAEVEFKDLNLKDPFFDTLRNDYEEFDAWVTSKPTARAYCLLNERRGIEALLHTKVERGPITDVEPNLEPGVWLKVGTFKANPHGTRLGERLIKKAFDQAIRFEATGLYVTVLQKHAAVINLFKRYGFEPIAEKKTKIRTEQVLVRPLRRTTGNVLLDYPTIISRSHRKFLLGIYPVYHTRLFPDSILENEDISALDEISYTNSIHKVYVTWMDLQGMTTGDVLLIYRTKDEKGPAWYRSVATSICVVEQVRLKRDFVDVDDYLSFCRGYSVFDEKELRGWWPKQNLAVIRMTYNAAFLKRLNRKRLIEEVGLNEEDRWGLMELSDQQLNSALTLGQIDERIIVR